MANRENVLRVRDAIAAAPDDHFNMAVWSCGSVACVGGIAEIIMKGEGILDPLFDETCEWVGLDNRSGNELFFADTSIVGLGRITKAHAIQHLTDIADGMDPDWGRYV